MNYSLGQKTCVACPGHFTFNLITLVCQSPCNSTQIYNTTTKKCQNIPVVPTASLCPSNTPMWNATTLSCQACPSTAPLYNSTTKQCLPCPTSSVYDPSLNRCIPICPKG